ncbi:CD99 antigen-like [Phaenicophaeus curvirostris]|uniref:CD99 antigen-like n=1 Tax=Phaenicophaeus curvirostris TaxID=33595 RepID=UPI0037F0F1EE
MRGWRLLALAVLLLASAASVRGDFDDLDLLDALAPTKEPLPPKKPPPNTLGDFDDLDLLDALAPTKEPLPPKKPPPNTSEDDFHLEHAITPGDPKPSLPAKPRSTDKPKHNPRAPADSGDFADTDLLDNNSPGGGGSSGGSNERRDSGPNKVEESDASQGAVAGIVSAVVATVIGAVSSFIAYQKKKLCFKQSDEENVNMESHRGAQSEPPVQRTLLEN